MKQYLGSIFLIMISLYGQSQTKSEKPNELMGEVVKKGEKYYINLQWRGPAEEDTLYDGYYLYNNFPPAEVIYLNGRIGKIPTNSYSYKTVYPYGADYYFAVQACSSSNGNPKSMVSDTIKIRVPSSRIPTPIITTAEAVGDRLKIKWDYADILDLSEFQLFVSGDTVKVVASSRDYEYPIIEDKKTFKIQLMALTESGLSSEISSVVFVTR